MDGGRGRKAGRGQAAGLVLLGPGACAGHTGLAWEGSGWLAPLCPGICAGYAGQGREEPEKWVPGGKWAEEHHLARMQHAGAPNCLNDRDSNERLTQAAAEPEGSCTDPKKKSPWCEKPVTCGSRVSHREMEVLKAAI